MLLKELEYVRPGSVEEAVTLLSTIPDAGILAGGQSLLNVLKMRIGSYTTLIDISRLEELQTLTESDKDLHIGAGVTYRAILRSMELLIHRPILAHVAGRIADQQVRNRGTIGGNCCYNDPTCHFPPLLVALGAEMEILGPRGARAVPADQFFLSYYQTALTAGEMLVSIRIPKRQERTGDSFSPLSVGGTDVLNVITSTCTVTLTGANRVESLSLVVAGAGERPLRLSIIETTLNGNHGTAQEIRNAVDQLDLASLEPPGDVHASAEYRRAMVPVMARRAIESALKDARRGSHD